MRKEKQIKEKQENAKKEDCIFCKIAKKEIPVEVIYENNNFIAFPDQNQHTPGHSLVIPKKHFVNIMDLPETLGSELIEAVKAVAELRFKEDKKVGGFNLVMNNFPAAGQVVMHAHVHVVPRRRGDHVHIYKL